MNSCMAANVNHLIKANCKENNNFKKSGLCFEKMNLYDVSSL